MITNEKRSTVDFSVTTDVFYRAQRLPTKNFLNNGNYNPIAHGLPSFNRKLANATTEYSLGPQTKTLVAKKKHDNPRLSKKFYYFSHG